jgi:hypothetical protein
MLLFACDDNISGVDPARTAILYKLKGDYINNVCIGLAKDKSRIIVYPSPWDPCGDSSEHPLLLKNGYYIDNKCTYGPNSAYLQFSKTEYSSIFPISSDSMMHSILDADPYLEYYIDEADILKMSCPGCFVFDTAYLNILIINNELSKYLKRIK